MDCYALPPMRLRYLVVYADRIVFATLGLMGIEGLTNNGSKAPNGCHVLVVHSFILVYFSKELSENRRVPCSLRLH